MLFISINTQPWSDFRELTPTFISPGFTLVFNSCFISSDGRGLLALTVILYLLGFGSLTTDAYVLFILPLGSAAPCALSPVSFGINPTDVVSSSPGFRLPLCGAASCAPPLVSFVINPTDFGSGRPGLQSFSSVGLSIDGVCCASFCFSLQLCNSSSSLLTFFVKSFISLR